MEPTMEKLAIRLLGPIQVLRNGRAITLELRHKIFLAVLASAREMRIRRDRLIAIVWPGEEGDHEQSVATACCELRRALGTPSHRPGQGAGPFYNRETSEVHLDERFCEVDVVRFRTQLRSVRAHSCSDSSPGRCR